MWILLDRLSILKLDMRENQLVFFFSELVGVFCVCFFFSKIFWGKIFVMVR